MSKNEDAVSIYIHVPFCVKKCEYCDFLSFDGQDSMIAPYFDALMLELVDRAASIGSRLIKSIYIGGGTPSVVDSELVAKLLETLYQAYDCKHVQEITIECNPNSLTSEKAADYIATGINRLSIGLQSTQRKLLKKMGRSHTYRHFVAAYKAAYHAGFDNIGIDLLFGYPGQTLAQWEENVQKVLEYDPAHISCYDLKIEEGTALYEQVKNGSATPPSDEINRKMYSTAIRMLKKAGYEHYEISNFAKPGYRSVHNVGYWKLRDYIGIGAGAHSLIQGKRIENTKDLYQYTGCIRSNQSGVSQVTELTDQQKMDEYVMLGFRLLEGIDCRAFYDLFQCDFKKTYNEPLAALAQQHLIEYTDHTIKLSRLGLDFANRVFMEFI